MAALGSLQCFLQRNEVNGLSDSNVYVVSPPTLYMPGGGMAFCLIGDDKTWQGNVIELLEKTMQSNQITFYVNESGQKDPKAWVWYWHIVDNCDLIICDVSNTSEHEIRMALAMIKQDQPVIFHIRPGNDEFISLLNAISIPWFEEVENLIPILEATFAR